MFRVRLRDPPPRLLLDRDADTSLVGLLVILRSIDFVNESEIDDVLLNETVPEFVTVFSRVGEFERLLTKVKEGVCEISLVLETVNEMERVGENRLAVVLLVIEIVSECDTVRSFEKLLDFENDDVSVIVLISSERDLVPELLSEASLEML